MIGDLSQLGPNFGMYGFGRMYECTYGPKDRYNRRNDSICVTCGSYLITVDGWFIKGHLGLIALHMTPEEEEVCRYASRLVKGAKL